MSSSSADSSSFAYDTRTESYRAAQHAGSCLAVVEAAELEARSVGASATTTTAATAATTSTTSVAADADAAAATALPQPGQGAKKNASKIARSEEDIDAPPAWPVRNGVTVGKSNSKNMGGNNNNNNENNEKNNERNEKDGVGSSAAAGGGGDGGVSVGGGGYIRYGDAPYDISSFLSRLTFAYVRPLLRTGFRRPLQYADLAPLSGHDRPTHLRTNLEAEWNRSIEAIGGTANVSKWTLWRVIARVHRVELFWSGLWALVEAATFVAQPVVLRLFLNWLIRMQETTTGEIGAEGAATATTTTTMTTATATAMATAAAAAASSAATNNTTLDASASAAATGYGEGVGIAVGLVAISLVQAVTHHLLYYQTMRLGWNLRSGFTALLHNKSMRVAGGTALGRAISLVSTDTLRFDMFAISVHYLWVPTLQIVAVTCLIAVATTSWAAAVSGLGVMLLVVTVLMRFGKGFKRRRAQTVKETDTRMRMLSELLKSMLTVKAFGWEAPFARALKHIREREAAAIRVSQAMKACNVSIFFAAPAITTMVIVLVMRALGATMNLPEILEVVALVNVLRVAVGKNMARFFETAPEAHVAVKRIQRFLAQEEVATGGGCDSAFGTPPAEANIVLEVGPDASFFWRPSEEEGENKVPKKLKALSAAAKPLPLMQEQLEGKEEVEEGEEEEEAQEKGQVDEEPLENGDRGEDNSFSNSNSAVGGSIRAVSNLHVRAHPGSLIMVGGPVGSGKSALLLGLLGELPAGPDTRVLQRGRTAYVAQRPWILAGTLRDNILFGQPFEADWYTRVLEACCLTIDISNLPDGDQTEIGERGVNLSGGQKARVSLARACYARPALALLDDPLSAVDPAVGRHLMDHVITGLLCDAAVVLVTHHVHYFTRASDILLVRPGGRILPCASLREMEAAWPELSASVAGSDSKKGIESSPVVSVANKIGEGNTAFPQASKLVPTDSAITTITATTTTTKHTPTAATVANDETVGASAKNKNNSSGGDTKTPIKLVKAEDRALGVVTRATYTSYARKGGSFLFAAVFLFFMGAQSLLVAVDFWLQSWANLPTYAEQSQPYLTNGYAALVVSAAVVGLVRALLFFTATLQASTGLHDTAASRVLRAPMAFFSRNPLGRILNRFSADVGQVDALLPLSLFDTFQLSCMAISSVIVVCVAVPWILIFFPFLMVALVLIRRYTSRSLRELKRLDAMSRSPVFAQYAATLSGTVAVRAYGQQVSRQLAFEDALDRNCRAWYWWLLGNRWIGFRLDMLSSIVVALAVAFGCGLARTIDPGFLGVALVYVISLSGLLQFVVRQSALVETYFTSVERLLTYSNDIEVEPLEEEEDPATAATAGTTELTKAPWPGQGGISADNLCVRYQQDAPRVLNNLAFTLPAGSKMGVVGRTGSGKSSLIQALFRLNIVDGGSVYIDGVDTATVPLSRLRGSLCLIPQEPALFSGTLRYNLDPFEAQTDAALWSAIKAVGLKMPGTDENGGGGSALEATVAEGGDNLSVGQRQLVALARALLRGAKIVVMDEATANIDGPADEAIQRTLREAPEFKQATLIIVAHRIATIADADYVLALDAGRVVEFGAPKELLRIENGLYKSMVEASMQK